MIVMAMMMLDVLQEHDVAHDARDAAKCFGGAKIFHVEEC